jgi:hypothetical protein
MANPVIAEDFEAAERQDALNFEALLWRGPFHKDFGLEVRLHDAMPHAAVALLDTLLKVARYYGLVTDMDVCVAQKRSRLYINTAPLKRDPTVSWKPRLVNEFKRAAPCNVTWAQYGASCIQRQRKQGHNERKDSQDPQDTFERLYCSRSHVAQKCKK